MERRVVITGSSAITPIGHGKDQIVKSLQNGISGIKTCVKKSSSADISIPRFMER